MFKKINYYFYKFKLFLRQYFLTKQNISYKVSDDWLPSPVNDKDKFIIKDKLNHGYNEHLIFVCKGYDNNLISCVPVFDIHSNKSMENEEIQYLRINRFTFKPTIFP